MQRPTTPRNDGDMIVGNEYNEMEQSTFMVGPIFDEMAVSCWPTTHSVTYDLLDNEVHNHNNHLSSMDTEASNIAFDHLLHLYSIQCKIRHHLEVAPQFPPTHEFSLWWRSNLLAELELWKQSMPFFVDRNAPFCYLRPKWMEASHRITLFYLLEGPRSIIGGEHLDIILEAAKESCRAFWLTPGHDLVVTFTMTSLLYQFRAGIILLYCFWATPPSMQCNIHSAQETHDAIAVCSETLGRYAERWEAAAVYRDTFNLFASEVPRLSLPGDEFWMLSPAFYPEFQRLFEALRHDSHFTILGLLEDMAYKARPTARSEPGLPRNLPMDIMDIYHIAQFGFGPTLFQVLQNPVADITF